MIQKSTLHGEGLRQVSVGQRRAFHMFPGALDVPGTEDLATG